VAFVFIAGITPWGYISFVSKAYGGRASDTYITTNSGILNLLEPGDEVLADKGFPTLKCDNVVTVIPPRGRRGQQYSEEDKVNCRKIASVRIHVERSIQRLKLYKILSHQLQHSLLKSINKIIFVCCVLANLGTPIIKATPEEEEEFDDDDEGEENFELDLD
jgi:hypothetical protein